VDWCASLLGGGFAAIIGWGVADGRGAAVENLITVVDDEQWTMIFFSIIRTVGFFLDQTESRVKHKHVDRLIVKTIKTLALITNLMRDNK
jgi:hypothetical protein